MNTLNKAKALKLLGVLTICSSLSIGAYMLSAKDITLSIDEEIREVTTYSRTIKDLLEEEKIALSKEDYINVPLDTKLENNMNIVIKKAKPYTVSVGKDKFEVKSIYDRVEDILKENEIELGEKDYTKPALHETVEAGDEIQVIKVEEVFEEVEEAIPYEKLVKQNKNMDIGQEKVTQKGQKGLKVIEIKKVYENGELVAEEVVGEEVVKEPVPQIIERGTRKVATASRGSSGNNSRSSSGSSSRGKNFKYKKVLTMTATAYDLSYESTGKRPGDKYYGITASGTKARPGVVAVDPKVIPLGTKLYVESLDGSKDYGFCVAEDTGGAIKGNRIDLFFNTREEVKRFGVRKVRVYILD